MNIILQHFAGELRELDKLSLENMRSYAKYIGAEHELIAGFPFREHLTAPCQKVHMLNERFDSYDQVLMVDIDMFATKRLKENIFEVERGIGLYEEVQKRLHKRLSRTGRISAREPYWGGAIYKMNKETRVRMREQFPENDSWMDFYNEAYHYEDEGIIAQLAGKAKIPFFVMNRRWCQCSFLPKKEPGFIHIRTKVTPQGPKREKIDNYRQLVKDSIIC